MKKTICYFLVVLMLPLASFADQKPLTDKDLDGILGTKSKNVCDNVTSAKADLQTKAAELKKQRAALETAIQTNSAYKISQVALKIGVVAAGLGVTTIVLTGIITKLRYGHAFFELSGLVPMILSSYAIKVGAIVAIVGGATEVWSGDNIRVLERATAELDNETTKLYNALQVCPQ